jgi:excisionase family DNA binding protein
MQPHERQKAAEQNRAQRTEPPIWVSVNEAIRLASIQRTRLYELLGDGTLRSIKLGGKRLISYASILALGEATNDQG